MFMTVCTEKPLLIKYYYISTTVSTLSIPKIYIKVKNKNQENF